jgi:hypothetical protein
MSTIDSANPPQEYPDIVGARPTNPLAANFKSFIPASAHLPELTWPHLITGTILGIIFGASSLYLVLKVGLTVSASIPVAVLSITIFRVASKLFRSRDATILQRNGGPACRDWASDRGMANSSQSVSKRAVRGSTRLDSVFYNLSSSVSRGP